MIVRVHPASGIPIYLQIEQQVKQAIAAGVLQHDDALPPVRRLAAEIRVNPNTVARAYQNLERDGAIRTVQGGGCYVNGQAPGLLESEKARRLRPLATQLAVEATQLRFGREPALELLEEAFTELEAAGARQAAGDREARDREARDREARDRQDGKRQGGDREGEQA